MKRMLRVAGSAAVLLILVLGVAHARPENASAKAPLEVTYYFLPG
jgi:hypothetical protein